MGPRILPWSPLSFLLKKRSVSPLDFQNKLQTLQHIFHSAIQFIPKLSYFHIHHPSKVVNCFPKRSNNRLNWHCTILIIIYIFSRSLFHSFPNPLVILNVLLSLPHTYEFLFYFFKLAKHSYLVPLSEVLVLLLLLFVVCLTLTHGALVPHESCYVCL
jgi:hypothetical protein